jgi:protein-tyrosine-phosphatase
MEKKKVLFVCIHNSARSQMAEAFLNLLAGDRFEAESAGLEPGSINPLAVEVMKETGIDISKYDQRRLDFTNRETVSLCHNGMRHSSGSRAHYIRLCEKAAGT